VDLTGKTALVTGANRGIGRALVERLSQRPLRSIVAGVRDVEHFETLGIPAGAAGEVRAVHVDLSSQENIERSCAELDDDPGKIDLLVNNAGLMTGGLLEEQSIDEI
jgi:NAD(P)-dependent dehydrogenase (short-subunit alcohol dehydrogenase family)